VRNALDVAEPIPINKAVSGIATSADMNGDLILIRKFPDRRHSCCLAVGGRALRHNEVAKATGD
jgi:hypothetical protein